MPSRHIWLMLSCCALMIFAIWLANSSPTGSSSERIAIGIAMLAILGGAHSFYGALAASIGAWYAALAFAGQFWAVLFGWIAVEHFHWPTGPVLVVVMITLLGSQLLAKFLSARDHKRRGSHS